MSNLIVVQPARELGSKISARDYARLGISVTLAVVAWNLGQKPGILVAFLASIIWYVADRYAGDRYSTPFYGYWNTGMHFTTFIINAVAFAKIKSSLDQRYELERNLVETREQLQQLARLVPVCPGCHKPRVPEPVRAQSAEASAFLPSEALCDDCRARVAPGGSVGLVPTEVGVLGA